MSRKTLLDETVALLHKRGDLSIRRIADETDLGYEWLSSLNQGRIDDPGIKRIEKLHAYLTKKLNSEAAA